MNRPSRRLAVCYALLGAMAYGLGAAPCGCWEHSGWRAAFAQLTGVEGHRHSDEHHGDEDGADHGACESRLESPAILRDRHHEAVASAHAAIQPAIVVVGATAESIDSLRDRSEVGLSAQPLRAQLQVFRL